MTVDTRLSLENPKWRKLVLDNAKEYHAKGLLEDYIEANRFDLEVVEFIRKEVNSLVQ